jgi:hypothetical protein
MDSEPPPVVLGYVDIRAENAGLDNVCIQDRDLLRARGSQTADFRSQSGGRNLVRKAAAGMSARICDDRGQMFIDKWSGANVLV